MTGFEKIIAFYAERGATAESIATDMKHGYLTENATRSGEKVYYYADENTTYCVTEDGHELTETEIEEQLN